jgi:eukaryotic-like serine/threonine-protein kinase
VSDQKVCPTCGTEYPLSERFCPRDGTALRSSNAQGDLMGSIVAERYHILKKLGEGGMGTVYLAEHVKMGRKAALKVMNPGMNSDPDAIARFNREAANASRLNHPNVCGIYDFGETPEGLIYLAMEFIEGESLTSLIEKNGYLAAPRAASIIHQAADALAVAHDYGIVHRDLKPDNIMIAKGRDGSDMVKVVDFGIAKASSSDAQKVTKTGLVVGTPEYMSPEQLAGDKLDGRSDIYSLGLVAFNCLTGALPFPSETAQEAMIMRLTDQPKTLAEMKPDVAWPAELQAVMDKVLMRDADERYQKSAEFGRDIAKAVENMPAAVAAAGATMVIGASAADLPKTRMAAKGGATAKIEAPVPAPAAAAAPVAAKKSPVMLIVAAVVVIAAGGGAYAMLGGKKDSATQPATQPAAPPASSPANTPNPTADTKTAGQPGTATPPVKTAQNGEAQAASKSPAPAHGAAPPVAAPSTPADDPSATVAHWDEVINKGSPTASDATHAIDALTPIIPKLTGQEKSNAIFTRMMAYGIVSDEAGLCSAVKDVIANDANKNHVLTAGEAAKGTCK